jgi:regulator of protease activity HflC (stomatin/prohibitin superfamily)
MNLDRVISEIGEINKLLQEGLQEVSDDWGVRVDRVEIQKLVLPEELMASMHRKKAAEQDKMATVERAEAQRMTIDAIQSAAGKLTNPALQYLYIQSLQKIAEGKSNKIIFPLELSRLATGLANKLGTSYSEAQDKLVEDYQEKVASGAKPRSVIDDLRRELGIREEPLPKKKYKLAKGKVKFDF